MIDSHMHKSMSKKQFLWLLKGLGPLGISEYFIILIQTSFATINRTPPPKKQQSMPMFSLKK